jgi:hypothetical protein
MGKEYEMDANFVLTPAGRAARNADRAAVTREAKARADRLREEAKATASSPDLNSAPYNMEHPTLGVIIREPDMLYDAADAAIMGYKTQKEWIDAGRPR